MSSTHDNLPVAPRLSDLRPHLAAQADGWDATRTLTSSLDPRAWKCPQSHRFTASPLERIHDEKCPVCAQLEIKTFSEAFPELAKEACEWDPITTTEWTPGQIFGWKCEKSHVWFTPLAERLRGKGCAVCNQDAKPLPQLVLNSVIAAVKLMGAAPNKFLRPPNATST